jgi:hypothetical protein
VKSGKQTWIILAGNGYHEGGEGSVGDHVSDHARRQKLSEEGLVAAGPDLFAGVGHDNVQNWKTEKPIAAENNLKMKMFLSNF